MKILDAVFVYHLVGHERVAWHGRYHAHGCDEYELHFFLEGYGSFLCGKTRYPISPEKVFLTAPGEFHSITPDMTARPITYYAFLFYCPANDTELLRLMNEIVSKNAQSQSMSSTNRLQCEDITKLFRSGDDAFIKAAEYLLLSLMYHVYRKCGLSCVDPRESQAAVSSEPAAGRRWDKKQRTSGHIHVTRALKLMQKNVRDNLGVDEIARILALSTEHFIRLFRAEIKLTPHQYMRRLKIEGASGLLISTTKSIGEISEWFGFENQFHFSRCFKKCTGISPIEYRKTYLQAVDFT